MAAISKVDKKLDGHSDRLDKIESAIIEFRAIAKTTEKLSHLVMGNGEPGLDEQARTAEARLKANEKAVNELMQKFDALVPQLQPVIIFYRVGLWMATFLGASVLALIWGLLTGKVEMNFL